MGGGLDAAWRGRGGRADHRTQRRLEADRGAAPALRARGTPIRLVSDRVPSTGPFGAHRAAHRRGGPPPERLAQREAARPAPLLPPPPPLPPAAFLLSQQPPTNLPLHPPPLSA